MALDSKYYMHDADKAAFKSLKAIPGFHQLMKAFMNVWVEKQYKIVNMSSCLRINEEQLSKYYNMLPPICEKLEIEIPELYLELDVVPNSYTYGDTSPFIVITSGLLETIPDELVPTVLAHECGHIACHHSLYTTMGSIIINGAGSGLRLLPFGSLVTLPIQVAFYYWMRCSEYSADRAAMICDGTASKMSDVCMRLAGFDKDIEGVANKEAFIAQASDYLEMVEESKWNKTLEFLVASMRTHPLTAVRALECQKWEKTDVFKDILDGSYLETEMGIESDDTSSRHNKIIKHNRELSIFQVKSRDANARDDKGAFEEKPEKRKMSARPFTFPNRIDDEDESVQKEIGKRDIPDEIRKYKELMDDGIITKKEFEKKKKQLLDI